VSTRSQSRTPPHQTSEAPHSPSNCNCNSKETPTVYANAEYDDLTFEDRDAIDAQNHELALEILNDGNKW
jgi:hypothetical protein